MLKNCILYLILITTFFSCKKCTGSPAPETGTTPITYSFSNLTVNGAYSGFTYYGLNNSPVIKITFSSPINSASTSGNIMLTDAAGNPATFTSKLENNDNTVVLTATPLQPITKYILNVNNNLLSKTGGKLQSAFSVNLITAVDKFARISDEELLTLVQKQTFKYFRDFAHPISSLARERNISGNMVTSGWAGFGIMALITAQINHNYCKANPLANYSYSENCWGLTASDIPNRYSASAPGNDQGIIAPTTALSSFPYTPTESMQALQYFYYKLGNKTWGEYGFTDAFSLKDLWFASSTLAIDQGQIVVMIENYRTKLIWNLFMSDPEIKAGMKNLRFSSPNL